MGLISPAQVSDGSTADASDVNSPINTIANEFNGNIDNANIKSAAAIDASKLASGSITDTQMATAVKPVTRFTDDFFDHVASGCVWTGDSYGSTRVASMTAGVVYVSGIRATVSAVTSRTFTASKDTYIDVDSAGAITYTEVANNAASPALSAGNVRIGIIVTAAGSIAAVGSVNQGQENKVLPIASSIPYQVTDSLGNLICSRDPNRKILGYRQIVANYTGTAAITQVTGLTVPVIVPTGRKIKVTFFASTTSLATPTQILTTTVWDGTVGSGTQLAAGVISHYVGAASGGVVASAVLTPSASSKTYNGGVQTTGSNPTVAGGATTPSYLIVELV